jgi:hypothetical protein
MAIQGRIGAALVCVAVAWAGGCNKAAVQRFFGTAAIGARPASATEANAAADVRLAALAEGWNEDRGVPWPAVSTLAQLANCAYLSADDAQARLAKWGLAKPRFFAKGSLNAYVAADRNVVVIAFRGTDDAKDWLVNADCLREPVADGQVHSGFYRGAQALYGEILAAANEHGAAKKRVWITGHSLGGALAVAFAYRGLADGALRPAAVVTFGQPLLADGALAGYLQQQLGGRYVRVMNGRDIVTRVPAAFVHAGRLIHLRDGTADDVPPRTIAHGAADVDPRVQPLSLEQFDALRRQLRGIRNGQQNWGETALQVAETLAAVADHSVDAYVRSIEQMAARQRAAAGEQVAAKEQTARR